MAFLNEKKKQRGFKMKREHISIDLLLLSDGNPRLDPSFGEDEAILNMVSDQNEKLFELAVDIVEHGLNPLDTIGVYPSEIYDGFFEVGEGNRRMCALKLLVYPERIQHINAYLYSKFKNLSKSYSPPSLIEVGVFDNELSMRHWMEIRHMGEQSGKGLSKWNSVQKARFNRKITGSDPLLDFWDWMIENNILSNEEIFRVTKTNWQRILREKYFSFLRIKYNENYSVLPKDIDVFTERIKAVQQKLDGQTVAIVYDQKRIEEFFNSISNMLYGKPYQDVVDEESEQIVILADEEVSYENDNKEQYIDDLTTKHIHSKDIVSGDGAENKLKTNTSTIGRDVFNGCATIIPYGYPIRTENMRLNKIINELKRLNADDFPNACGTLLRTLFELSAKVYLEKHDGKDHTTTNFEQAIRGAANALQRQGCINGNQHSSICSDIDNLRKIFNGYMHNTDSYPSSEALKNFFKCHRLFIQECLK